MSRSKIIPVFLSLFLFSPKELRMGRNRVLPWKAEPFGPTSPSARSLLALWEATRSESPRDHHTLWTGASVPGARKLSHQANHVKEDNRAGQLFPRVPRMRTSSVCPLAEGLIAHLTPTPPPPQPHDRHLANPSELTPTGRPPSAGADAAFLTPGWHVRSPEPRHATQPGTSPADAEAQGHSLPAAAFARGTSLERV